MQKDLSLFNFVKIMKVSTLIASAEMDTDLSLEQRTEASGKEAKPGLDVMTLSLYCSRT